MRFSHGLLDELAQLGALELHGGDVHADRHEVRALLAPLRDVAAHAIEHELADRNDEAGLLGHFDEALGRDVALRRMFPAQQRFEAGDAARVDVDDGLVVHVELVQLEPGAQATTRWPRVPSACGPSAG